MTQIVYVQQGNLFQLAAAYLNDATQWIRIAQRNGLSDAWIASSIPVAITIPDPDPAAGGGIAQ